MEKEVNPVAEPSVAERLPIIEINGIDCLEDSKGRFVPLENVKDYDLFKTDFVYGMVAEAQALQDIIKAFKRKALEDVQTFREIALERYGVKVGGRKGGIAPMTFKGDMQVILTIADRLVFNEILVAAKALIDECVIDWLEGANPNILALVQDAFQTDQQGKISTDRVLGLRRLKIEDERWARAMEAINDSIMIQDTKPYIRFRRRDETTGQWVNIPLDLAAI